MSGHKDWFNASGWNTSPSLTNPLARDQAALAQRKANSPLMAAKPQIPCDHGLFSDEANQLDLIEMLMEPTDD
jgi:hypothetical protein